MKKLLLTLAAIVGLGFAASADSYTIEFKANAESKNNGPEIKATTLVAEVVSAGDTYVESFSDFKQAYVACNYGLKIGANKQAGNITINLSEAGKVNASKIEVYASASKNATYQKLEVNGTEFSFATSDVNSSFKVCEINPNAAIDAIVLKKTNASTTSSQQGFIFVSKIVVTYTNSGTTLSPAGLKYEETAFNVNLGDNFTAPKLTNPNNLAVTYSSSKEEVATVDASTGEVTIAGVGTTTITATSAETDKYYEGKASYTLTVVKVYKSVAEFYTLNDGEKGIVGFDLTVAYANGAYNYVTTGSEWTLIYGYDLNLKAGDVIPAGWEGEFDVFNGLTQIKPVKIAEVTETGKSVTYADATSLSLDMINEIVVLKGVKLEAATPSAKVNFTGKIGENTINFRNNFAVASVEAGTYDVTCAVSYYVKNATDATDPKGLQLYPISYKVDTTGIDEIEAAENAPAEYFNLQGVRVANPENGLYIRRQGNKVTKVIVK